MQTVSQPSPAQRRVSFADALRQVRAEKGYDLHTVADHCGVSEGVIRQWEAGESTPDTQQAKRLFGMFSRLRWIGTYVRLKKQAPSAPVVPQDMQPFQRAATNGKKLSEEPEEPPFEVPTDFPAALRALRLHEGISTDDLAGLVDVTTQAISAWETGRIVPVRLHFEALRTLFPALPEPVGMQDIPPPDGGKDKGKLTWRDRLSLVTGNKLVEELAQRALGFKEPDKALDYLRELLKQVKRLIKAVNPDEPEEVVAPAPLPPEPPPPLPDEVNIPGVIGLGAKYAASLIAVERLYRQLSAFESKIGELRAAHEVARANAEELLKRLQEEAVREALSRVGM